MKCIHWFLESLQHCKARPPCLRNWELYGIVGNLLRWFTSPTSATESLLSRAKALCPGSLCLFRCSPGALRWTFIVYDIEVSIWRWHQGVLIYLVCWRLSSSAGLLTRHQGVVHNKLHESQWRQSQVLTFHRSVKTIFSNSLNGTALKLVHSIRDPGVLLPYLWGSKTIILKQFRVKGLPYRNYEAGYLLLYRYNQ